MKVRTILYHDVVDGDADSSGFPGPAAARYKLTRAAFAGQLAAMSDRFDRPPMTFTRLRETDLARASNPPFLITFDDGGVSSMHIADALERHGWRGNFFITTDRIGTAGFVTRADVSELSARGHGRHRGDRAEHPRKNRPRRLHVDGADVSQADGRGGCPGGGVEKAVRRRSTGGPPA